MEPDSQVENELKTLDTIFKGGTRIIRIPDYQRGYSWETQQRTDLLKAQFHYEVQHPCGAIIISRLDTQPCRYANIGES